MIQSKILSCLTTKECEKCFPAWTETFQNAFEKIKEIVISRECLTIIDHKTLNHNKIFLMTDASERATGAVLSFGPTWESARPVAFDSRALRCAELNYAVHEKELLAIVRAIKKWHVDLLGSPFLVYTSHKMLLNFHTQRDLSWRQARWMKELSAYDCKFVYIKGSDNTIADALSRYPSIVTTDNKQVEGRARHPYNTNETQNHLIFNCSKWSELVLATAAALTGTIHEPETTTIKSSISVDESFIAGCKSGYDTDPGCKKLLSASRGMPELTVKNGLWFVGERLIIPCQGGLQEEILCLAHDTLGHFGFYKSYESIRQLYFWPGMRKDLEEGYIPGCRDCMKNKSFTTKPSGPLHPLPVPDGCCSSILLDFIGPLPVDEGYDCILTITDRMGSDMCIIPMNTTLSAEECTFVFFNNWYCKNRLPNEIISDRDKLFVSKFWTHLMTLAGVKHKLSTSYHPQSNGSSKQMNKTVNQCLRFHVK